MICDSILSLASAIRSSRNKLLEQFGLSQSQYDVLRMIYHSPEHACMVSHVADKLGWLTSASSAIGQRLIDTGWLEKNIDPRNRRTTYFRIPADMVPSFEEVERAVHAHDRPWRKPILAALQPFWGGEAAESLSSLGAGEIRLVRSQR